jgi:hypothetical protein
MSTPIPTLAVGTDALSAVLRPCAISPRPIPYPADRQIARIRGQR